jgi:metallo-beta-lactamase family protein
MHSAHADSDGLLRWLSGLQRPPQRVFMVHGEPAASEALRERIERELQWPATVPLQGEEFTL